MTDLLKPNPPWSMAIFTRPPGYQFTHVPSKPVRVFNTKANPFLSYEAQSRGQASTWARCLGKYLRPVQNCQAR